jgi:hypothetical protein
VRKADNLLPPCADVKKSGGLNLAVPLLFPHFVSDVSEIQNIRDLNIMLFSICGFGENRRKEGLIFLWA